MYVTTVLGCHRRLHHCHGPANIKQQMRTTEAVYATEKIFLKTTAN